MARLRGLECTGIFRVTELLDFPEHGLASWKMAMLAYRGSYMMLPKSTAPCPPPCRPVNN
jgi:hypothetical protein